MINAIPWYFRSPTLLHRCALSQKHANNEDIDASHDRSDAIQEPEVAFLCALSKEVDEGDYH